MRPSVSVTFDTDIGRYGHNMKKVLQTVCFFSSVLRRNANDTHLKVLDQIDTLVPRFQDLNMHYPIIDTRHFTMPLYLYTSILGDLWPKVKLKVYQISANLVHRELRNATFEGEKMTTPIIRPDSGYQRYQCTTATALQVEARIDMNKIGGRFCIKLLTRESCIIGWHGMQDT